jgi:hypothetical protein
VRDIRVMAEITIARIGEKLARSIREREVNELRRKIEEHVAINRARAEMGLRPVAYPDDVKRVKAKALALLNKRPRG